MERRILLPTDFSDNSWSAIVYALKLFKDETCLFYFLNTIDMGVSSMANISNKLLKIMKEKALHELLQFKEMAEQSNGNSNHSFEIVLSSKLLTDAIETTVKKHDIELIIMGTKGATGVKELFYGSNTIHVINSVKLCPVLIIPEDFDFVEPKQIAFATDFNRPYEARDLQPLLILADLYNAKIRVVHINIEEALSNIQEYHLIMLKELLQNHEHSFHWMPDYSSKVLEIKEFITELGIDILAMVQYKHTLIEKMTKEPVIKKMGCQPMVPFLVMSQCPK